MEPNNETPNEHPTNETTQEQPAQPPETSPTPSGGFSLKDPKTIIIGISVLVIVLLLALLFTRSDDSGDDSAADQTTITSFEDCVAAGYPVMESFPEQCAVPGGEIFVNEEQIDQDPVENNEEDTPDEDTTEAESDEGPVIPVTVTRAYYETDEAADYGWAESSASQFLIVELEVSNESDQAVTYSPENFQVTLIDGVFGDYETSTERVFKTFVLDPGATKAVTVLVLTPPEAGEFPLGQSEAKISWGSGADQELAFSIES